MNKLYPIFVKLDVRSILIVGGGFVALEKLTFLFKSSPNAKVSLVAPVIRPQTEEFLADKNVQIFRTDYDPGYLAGHSLVIATTDIPAVNLEVAKDARAAGLLVNVADTPSLCDFYLGSIVTRGHLKIAISTQGKSPTLARRLREWLEAVLPDELDSLLDHLFAYRLTLRGNFEEKIARMNKMTEEILELTAIDESYAIRGCEKIAVANKSS